MAKHTGEFLNVLVPVNGSDADRHALRILSKLVDARAAFIVAVFVVEVPQSLPLDADMSEEVERGEEALEIVSQDARSVCRIRAEHLRTDILQARSAGAAIVDEAADLRCDLIVMSAPVRLEHGRPTIGETADYVLKHAHCEVMLLRHPYRASREGTLRT
jgi:nucleotide-binding universal stress UspA family protein